VTKHFKGYEIMREIMAKHSTRAVEGVPSLEHNLEELEDANPELPLVLDSPIDRLAEQLRHAYPGQTLSVRQIFEDHSVGKAYLLQNYKDALRRLELNGLVQANPAADIRPRRKGQVTMEPQKTRITFL
jgi:hypothetical protein